MELLLEEYSKSFQSFQAVLADKNSYDGYAPQYQYVNPAPITAGWLIPGDLSNGFVNPASYAGPDVICHIGATNAQTEAAVKAGQTVEFQWTPLVDFIMPLILFSFVFNQICYLGQPTLSA